MVRVAGVHDQLDAGVAAHQADGLTAAEPLDPSRSACASRAERQARCWEDELRPALAEHGIRIVPRACSRTSGRASTSASREIFPVLTPLAVGPGRPFPYISTCRCQPRVPCATRSRPRSLRAREGPERGAPRFVALASGPFVPLEDVIARNLDRLFPGMEILGHAVFRVTRDADLGSPTRPTISSRRSRPSCAGAASARWCGSRSGQPCRTTCARSSGVARSRSWTSTRSRAWSISTTSGRCTASTPRRPARPALRGRVPPAAPTTSRPFATCATSTARPPSVRSFGATWSASRAGGERPRVLAIKTTVTGPRRLGARAGADEAAEAGKQAVAGGGDRALRRAAQHRVGAGAGAGRRARVHGLLGPEDPREDAAGRPPGGRRVRTTATSAPATTTRRPRGSTRTSACSPPTRGSATISPTCSTRSPATPIPPASTTSWSPRRTCGGRSSRTSRRPREDANGRSARILIK